MRPIRSLSLLAPLFTLAACGLDPSKIAAHTLLADDGARLERTDSVQFAVVGNPAGEGTPALVSDLSNHLGGDEGLDFVVLMGGVVDSSSNRAWKQFSRTFEGVLAGPSAEGGVPAVPVAGAGEGNGDDVYRGWGAAFPGVGQDIGLNRVASWYDFDLVTDGKTWRFLVMDANRARLKSRWGEQLNWMKTAVEGEYDGLIVLFYDAPYSLAGATVTSQRASAPGDLLDALDAQIDETKLKAVFFAGPPANQVLAPDGPYGALYIGAGAGGVPLADLHREDPEDGAGEPLTLESSYDGTMVETVGKWSQAGLIEEKVVNEARALGEFEGRPRIVRGEAVPTTGWWEVKLNGTALSVQLHLVQPDGSYAPSWQGVTRLGGPWTTVP